MSIVTPSHVRATVELLRGNAVAHSGIDALVVQLHTLTPAARIDTGWLSAWDKPDGRIFNAITVRGDGGLGVEPMGVRSQGRVLIRCWSTTYFVANQIAHLVQQILYPVYPDWTGFVAANTVVDGFTGVSDPLEYQEPNHEFQRAMQMTANLWYRRIARVAA